MKAWEQISMNKSYLRRHAPNVDTIIWNTSKIIMHYPKRQAPGLVILFLLAAFTQPGINLLAEPCTFGL